MRPTIARKRVQLNVPNADASISGYEIGKCLQKFVKAAINHFNVL